MIKALCCHALALLIPMIAFAAPTDKPKAPPPVNFDFDPFGQNWNDAWRTKIAGHVVTIPKGQSVRPENLRAYFNQKDFTDMKARTATQALARVVKEILSDADKESLIRVFGTKESNRELDLLVSLAAQMPKLGTLGWVQLLDQFVSNSESAKTITRTRSSFSALAARGGKIVYHESLLQASDGHWMLVRGLNYVVTVGKEVRVLPLNYNRILVEIQK